MKKIPKIEIHVDLLKTTLKIISNWKAPGHDGIHGFWFKKFTSIHDRLSLEMNRCLQDAHVPEWMTKGKTILIQKDPSKGTTPNNYRPITCLPMMRKILTAQIRKKNLLFANKPRIVPGRTERMPQRIQRHSRITLHRSTHPKWEQDKTEKSSYGLDWQQEDMWYALTMLDITLSHYVQNITWSHKLHRTDHEDLESGTDSRRKNIAETKFQRGIFQGDALSPLLFIIVMMPLNHILRKCTAGYKLSRSQEKINHLLYMDGIKLFAKNERELETLINAVRIYSQDIVMEFGTEKMCHARHEKWKTTCDWRNGTTKSRQN